jgi:hypothetical protein
MGSNGDTSWATGAWLLISGVPSPGDLATLATDLYGIYEARILPHVGAGCTLTEVHLEYFTAGGSIVAESFAVHSGGDSSSALPANVAAVISWGILTTYRGGKPRNYIPGICSAALISRRLYSDTFVGLMQAAGASMLSDINALTTGSISAVSFGCVHFFRSGVALAPPTFDPYLSASAQKRVCTQRRRLGREV